VVLFQWWTAVTAHSYLVLAREAQRLGARVVFEMHEVSDVGEAALPLVGTYTRTMMAALARHIDGVIVHSSADAKTIQADGDVGLRVNHNLDVRVEGFDVHR